MRTGIKKIRVSIYCRYISIFINLVLIPGGQLYGQSYKTVTAGRTSFFKDTYGTVLSLRIDSAQYRGDSVLYPFSTISMVNLECYQPDSGSWIGRKILLSEEGWNGFVNIEGDTVTIRTDAGPGEEWPAYRKKGGLNVYASVIKQDTMSVFGLKDSVKIISFRVNDASDLPLEHPLNDLQVILSKQYGFFRTLNFYLFPDFFDPFQNLSVQEYELTGLDKPEYGLKNLTWFEVYDFQPGDELHMNYSNICWVSSESGQSTISLAKWTFLDRKNYEDSIVYLVAREILDSVITTSVSRSYRTDTVSMRITRNPGFDRLSGEVINSGYDIYSVSMTDADPPEKIFPYGMSFTFGGYSCWVPLITDGCIRENRYIKGLGGPYWSCFHWECAGGEEMKLVYFRKGEQEWGIPFIFNGTEDIEVPGSFRVYPNPARGSVQVEAEFSDDLDGRLEITDLSGRLLRLVILHPGENDIDLSGILPGLFIYRAYNSSTLLGTGRLLIQ